MSQIVWQGNKQHVFWRWPWFCLFRQEIYSTGLHRSKCTGSDMCQRAHASTRTHKQTRRNTTTGKHSPKRLCKKRFHIRKLKKKNIYIKYKMKRWKMNTPTKERPCWDWGRKRVKLSLLSTSVKYFKLKKHSCWFFSHVLPIWDILLRKINIVCL